MDLHHNIWLILLLSLPSQDIILGPGIQLCWCQPMHGAYPHLMTEPYSRLLRKRWNSLSAEIRNIQNLTSKHLNELLKKHTFLKTAFN